MTIVCQNARQPSSSSMDSSAHNHTFSLIREDDIRYLEKIHAAVLWHFEKPCSCPNPMLTDVWLPWARQAGYIGEHGPLSTLHHSTDWCKLRFQAILDFSWAVPCHDALQKCVHWASIAGGPSRIVEIGSGTGYWASLLQAYGADVVAVDTGEEYRGRNRAFPELVAFETGEKFLGETGGAFHHFPSTVRANGVDYLESHGGCTDRALFLCWPRAEFGSEILKAYHGNTLIWIGEADGCTWEMNEDERAGWILQESYDIPTWDCIRDFLAVYVRS